ncbi:MULTISPECIES: M16 family metallopeptidase [unclassified Aureimonas]|uniref:M16 family metallopeptidase n=1 Tax=unclassified Aureimonas TaxID=2615206 RepID=UPI0006F5A3E2|nr:MULTISPECIES: pitrilysin family protein [unclassified Aureimonas]KQT69734.1 zinc protease [Aureimonas sp. Leaf427]KQT76114.1 zinc protease [Aureimonas sp. Leaf460]
MTISQTFAVSTAARAGAVLSFTFGLGLAFATPSEAVEIQEVTSPGGIKALLVEDYTNPLIAVNFAFEGAGSTSDAPGKEGTGTLLTGLLDEGAGPIESAAFQSKLDELGVSLSFDVGLDNFTGSFRTIVENEDEAFDLLGLALNEPRFDDEPVARMRAQFVTQIVSNLNDPGALASKAWRQAVFPGHPYSRPSEGTAETLAAVTKADLQAFRTKGFARGNLVVGVVGAIDAKALGEKLDTVFGKLPEKADLPKVPDVAPVTGKTVAVPLAVPQTQIQFALPGVKRDDPDFFAAYLMNHVLGGGSFSSRLYQEVREKRGLAYGASSYLASYDHAAVLGAGTATRADKAQESVDIIRAEIKRMAENGPTEEELAKAKAYVKGAYAIQNLDSSLSIASTLVGIQLDRLGIDYIDKRQELIDAVTMDDVKRIGKKLLSLEPSVVTVGPAAS